MRAPSHGSFNAGFSRRIFGLRLIAIAVLVVTRNWDVVAFFPTNWKTCPKCTFGSFLGRSHERITTDAITSFDQSTFGVTTLTSSMKQAMQDIVDANAGV